MCFFFRRKKDQETKIETCLKELNINETEDMPEFFVIVSEDEEKIFQNELIRQLLISKK